MSRDPTPLVNLAELLVVARDGFTAHATPEEIAEAIDKLIKTRICESFNALLHLPGGATTEQLEAALSQAWGES